MLVLAPIEQKFRVQPLLTLLAVAAGPLPKFEGIVVDATPNPREAGTTSPTPGANAPIRVPPLNPDDVNKFLSLFEKSDVSKSGVLPGTYICPSSQRPEADKPWTQSLTRSS